MKRVLAAVVSAYLAVGGVSSMSGESLPPGPRGDMVLLPDILNRAGRSKTAGLTGAGLDGRAGHEEALRAAQGGTPQSEPAEAPVPKPTSKAADGLKAPVQGGGKEAKAAAPVKPSALQGPAPASPVVITPTIATPAATAPAWEEVALSYAPLGTPALRIPQEEGEGPDPYFLNGEFRPSIGGDRAAHRVFLLFMLSILTGAGSFTTLLMALTLLRLCRRQVLPNSMIARATEAEDEGEAVPFLSLFVRDQSESLRKRNLHALKPGHTLSVGGGDSDFLIRLVPVKADIARIRYNGQACDFIPKRRRFFPDIKTASLPDCVGKPIRLVPNDRYELEIRVDPVEHPARRLRRAFGAVALPV